MRVLRHRNSLRDRPTDEPTGSAPLSCSFEWSSDFSCAAASSTREGGKMTDKSTRFLHRRNEDGAYDSICRTCLGAVACSMARAELAENHKTHVCNSAFLAERGCLSRAASMRHPAAPTFQCDHRTQLCGCRCHRKGKVHNESA